MAIANASTEIALVDKAESPITKRGISEAQWFTLQNSLYPGAKPASVILVWDYCKARGLDPLKKPCHIVPMEVKDSKTGAYEWRDIVMPGIYELRATAQRTGSYLGHSKPEYGEVSEQFGVDAPEWCEITFYRWNREAAQKIEFPVRVYFREVVALRKEVANSRWSRAPIQMLTKCCEAAGLREAFPDEIGGEHTVEEIQGQRLNEGPDEDQNRHREGTEHSTDYCQVCLSAGASAGYSCVMSKGHHYLRLLADKSAPQHDFENGSYKYCPPCAKDWNALSEAERQKFLVPVAPSPQTKATADAPATATTEPSGAGVKASPTVSQRDTTATHGKRPTTADGVPLPDGSAGSGISRGDAPGRSARKPQDGSQGVPETISQQVSAAIPPSEGQQITADKGRDASPHGVANPAPDKPLFASGNPEVIQKVAATMEKQKLEKHEKPISHKQAEQLILLAQEMRYTDEGMKKFYDHFKIRTLKDLSVGQFNDAKLYIEGGGPPPEA